MNESFFVRGLLIGLSIAATVGPMSILCIQRTIHRGQRYGLISGLGIATADGIYGCIAAFGLTLISKFLVSQQFWIRTVGGLFLIYLGIKTVLTRPDRPTEHVLETKTNGLVGAYTTTFLLTLTNPLTILSFAAIFVGIGVGGASKSYGSAISVVLGVFVGSSLWWCILTRGVSLLRGKLTQTWLLWINRISGSILLLFGIVAFILALT